MVQNEQQHLLLSWGGCFAAFTDGSESQIFSDPARMAAKQKEEEEKQKKEQEAKKEKELSGSAKAVKELRHA